MKHRYTIAIDPGFGQTGVLLARGAKIKEWATFSCGTGSPPLSRAIALALRIVDLILAWVSNYSIERLEIVIERPIWKGNAASFELQWRLVQQLENDCWITGPETIWLTEVHPSTSKKLATGRGDATKVEVAEASPFERRHFPDEKTWTTMGDTWAHSLAAWGNNGTGLRLDLRKLQLAEVRE